MDGPLAIVVDEIQTKDFQHATHGKYCAAERCLGQAKQTIDSETQMIGMAKDEVFAEGTAAGMGIDAFCR